MITSVNPGIQYTCNSCGQNSKLSIQEPEYGFYKVTCFHCSAESIIRITHQSGLIRVSNTDKNHPELNPPASEAAEIEENSIDLVSGSTGESKGFFKSILNTFESIVSRLNVTFLKFRGRIFPLISGLSSGSTGNKKPFFEKVVKHHPAGLKDAIFTFHSVKRNFGKNFPSFQFGGKNKIVVGSALLIFPVIIFFSYFIYGIFEERNGISELLSELSKNKPTRILDRKGKVISEIFSRKTSSLKLKDYPASLISIVLGVEDRGFYKHHGIDYFAIIRAIFTNTFSMSYKQGASTITQQLARILIKDRRKSLLRKMREAQVAFALESKLSKDEILEAYMNEVYLGHGAYGFGDASMFYFEKSPTALSELEMVLLSSLASAPGKYSPLKNPQISQVRFNAIINSLRNKQIIRSGSDSEIKDLYSGLKRAATDTVFSTRFDQAKYVTEHIREILKSIDPSINIYEEGGYLVETTLVSDIQSSAGEIVKQYISELNQKGIVKKTRIKQDPKSSALTETGNSGLQAAIIAIDSASGEILFLHGGDEFSSSNQFNRAIQMRRQTGSSIKPVLYAAAIDLGLIHAGSRILDAPLLYRGMQGHQNWAPDNIGMSYDGEISVREALVKSKNTAAVQVAERIGSANIEKYFSAYFFPEKKESEKRFRNDLSVALGTVEISPLEMAMAFGSFSNDGIIRRPFLIKKITNSSGNVIYEYKDQDEFHLKIPEQRRVISPETAEVMVSILKGSANASGIRASGYKGEVAGKTGTTNDYKDAWFIGTRPGISMAVWIGYDDPAYGLGSRGMGAVLAAPLWARLGNRAEELALLSHDKFSFSKRAISKSICRESGDLSSESCPHPVNELFTPSGIPGKICSLKHIKSSRRELLKNIF